MRFNVAQLLKETVGASREYEIDEELDLIEDAPVVSGYGGRVRLMRIDDGIMATAEITTVVRMECGRCLEPIEQPLTVRFTETYRPTIDLATGAALPIEENEDYFAIDDKHVLDITEAVRQYILTDIPLSPVCRDECAGLCPICGADRNRVECECRTEKVDPRLAVLADLLRDSERS